MAPFEPIGPLAGGALMGLSAAMLWLFPGRIAGISGLFEGVLRPRRGDLGWRLAFLAGLAAGALIMLWLRPGSFDSSLVRSRGAVVLAGVLVGFGTRFASGCTSGHGLCGVGRLSIRSIAATVTFIGTGAVTVAVINRLLGGSV
jgi:uncharacterized membrane protein YedE/YeeE